MTRGRDANGFRSADKAPCPDLMSIWLAGLVRRWHTEVAINHREDLTCAHSARVALLLITIWPGTSREAIVEALCHDLGEAFAGDAPAPAKLAAPHLARALDQLEVAARTELGVPATHLGKVELDRIAFCDRLDAYLWAQHVDPAAIRTSEWDTCRKQLLDEVIRLIDVAVAPAVMRLLQ